MPASRDRTLRVGVTVVVALAVIMAGTFLIGREQRFWERKQSYEIRFTRINGLRVGSPVSLTGVDIGSVQDVSFPSDPNASYISIGVRVSGRAAARIREDSTARIRTIGLLGDKYIEISAGSPQSPMLPQGSIIPSVDPIDYEALLGESGDIITNIVETTNSLRNVLAAIENGEGLLGQMVKNREQGATTLADLQKTVAHVESTAAALERMAKEVEAGKGAFGVLLKRGEEAQRLLANLDRAAAELAKITGRLETAQGALPQLIQDKQYGQELLRDLRALAANLAEVSEKINRGKGTVAELVNDPSLYHDAKGLISATRSSWMFSVYQGIRGIFPPYAAPPAIDAPDAPAAVATPSAAAPPLHDKD
jgi:phospholipid/cholesterol/gamma-HCH transport system substrate-binding protein